MLALAVTAGMLGAVSPCGFALLPAYLSVMISGDDPARPLGPVTAVGRALRCALALTLGYVLVFGAFGLLLAPIEDALQPRLPWLTVTLGAGLALTGAWLLAGRSLPAPGRGLRAPALTGSAWSTVLFGMVYALASIGCSAGPFLAIVVANLRTGSTAGGLLLFVAYAAGMGLVIAIAAVAVALLRTSVLGRMRRAAALAPRLGGLVLLVTGGYVAWYGGYELRVAADRRTAGTDPVVSAAMRVQEAVAGAVGGAGWLWLLVALTLLVVAAAAITRRRHA